MRNRSYHVILNARSGTAQATGVTAETLRERFTTAGHEVTIDADSETSMAKRIERAQTSGADVIVAAGGDGTATAIANAIADTPQTLAILPLGTVNMLARDLGIPLEVARWTTALDTMEPRYIDVAEVNGRVFLHKVVIGFIPGLAAAREHVRGSGKLATRFALLRFFLRRMFRKRRIAVEITYRNGDKRIERVISVAVANNDYAEGFGRFFSRQQLDGHYLSLYLLRRLTLGDFARLAAEMGIGSWRGDAVIDIENIREISIRTRKPTIKVMLDGDVETLEGPLDFRIRPGALSILAPPIAEPAGDPAPVEVLAET